MQKDDTLGLAVYREQTRGLCLDLMVALSDEMIEEGITESPKELQRRYNAVLASLQPCPLQASCKRYHNAQAKLMPR